jgi:hypothetical protein
MSAKRRADTITRFCVPVKDISLAVDEPAGICSRLRPVTQSQSQPIGIDDDGDNASNFAPDDESDYSATELESDEEPRAKQWKGKGKAKAKGKARSKSSVLEALRELDGESNPRVMLISLKGVHVNQRLLNNTHEDHVAGALGLNLTVANNVFL